MQTPKTRSSSSGTPQKISPRYSGHTASSSNLLSKAPKERSLKFVDHRSPRSPATEKKRLGRVSELENQVSQLEKDLKLVKDQLCSTEEQKKLAQRDAEESNQQLEESKKQESALASALDEIERLKSQHKNAAESEDIKSKNSESELHKLKENLSNTLLIVEDMKNQLSDSKESEGRAHELAEETLMQLETAKETVEILRSDRLKDAEAYSALASELDQSRASVSFLEELVSKLNSDITRKDSQSVKFELRYNEEHARGEEEIENDFEMVERMRSECRQREEELGKFKREVEELKANLMDKETELQGICEENEGVSMKLEKAKWEIENLRGGLMEKEREWQSVSDENEKLKSEMKERSGVFEGGGQAEMEEELRRMKVQSEQWRKAAEVAAAIVAAGQQVERSGSMDSHCRGKTRSAYKDDEDLMKKKNGNVMGRFGVLWKKQHK